MALQIIVNSGPHSSQLWSLTTLRSDGIVLMLALLTATQFPNRVYPLSTQPELLHLGFYDEIESNCSNLDLTFSKLIACQAFLSLDMSTRP